MLVIDDAALHVALSDKKTQESVVTSCDDFGDR